MVRLQRGEFDLRNDSTKVNLLRSQMEGSTGLLTCVRDILRTGQKICAALILCLTCVEGFAQIQGVEEEEAVALQEYAKFQTPRDLSLELERLQALGTGMLIPDANTPYRADGGMVSLSSGFSPEFCEGLIAIDQEGISVYPVTVRTDDATGEMRFFNASNELFWVEYPVGNYSPGWVTTLRMADDALMQQLLLACAPVESDGSFAIPHTVIATNAPLRFALFYTNAPYTGFVSTPYKPSAHDDDFPVDSAFYTQDSDWDTMPDWWEILHGLDPNDSLDRWLDPDGDGLINMHEFWSRKHPQVPDVTASDSVLANATLAIDPRLVGKYPATALPIFLNYTSTNAMYRNPNCWAVDLDLTCASPWNSYSTTRRAGTLISPRHVLLAAHYDQTPTNTTIFTFVDMHNNVVTRTLKDKQKHRDYSDAGLVPFPDLTVGLLDSDVPANQISFAKVLPDNYADYIRDGRGVPCIRFDRNERAMVGNVTYAVSPAGGSTFAAVPPEGTLRKEFYGNNLDIGDSGNPMFIIIDGYPVLLTVWTSNQAGGSGTSVTAFKDDINDLMAELDGRNGNFTTYRLEEIDLSGFTVLPTP